MTGVIEPCCSASARKLRGKLAMYVATRCKSTGDPSAIEDREQQQRVFRWFAECFSLFDQETCSLFGGHSFWRGISFYVNEWRYEAGLKLDLFPAERWR